MTRKTGIDNQVTIYTMEMQKKEDNNKIASENYTEHSKIPDCWSIPFHIQVWTSHIQVWTSHIQVWTSHIQVWTSHIQVWTIKIKIKIDKNKYKNKLSYSFIQNSTSCISKTFGINLCMPVINLFTS